jgi:hypothetical protein
MIWGRETGNKQDRGNPALRVFHLSLERKFHAI